MKLSLGSAHAAGPEDKARPREVCAPLAYMGIRLDPHRNAAHADPISSSGSACTERVIPTNEDLMIARHTKVNLG